ncbi:MAG: hypothetical protein M5R36_25435 [Deltaproteobacteria bacterium]|nr:hypothetical protein [Deltaproteobacteria bacterium]
MISQIVSAESTVIATMHRRKTVHGLVRRLHDRQRPRGERLRLHLRADDRGRQKQENRPANHHDRDVRARERFEKLGVLHREIRVDVHGIKAHVHEHELRDERNFRVRFEWNFVRRAGLDQPCDEKVAARPDHEHHQRQNFLPVQVEKPPFRPRSEPVRAAVALEKQTDGDRGKDKRQPFLGVNAQRQRDGRFQDEVRDDHHVQADDVGQDGPPGSDASGNRSPGPSPGRARRGFPREFPV